MVAMAPLGELIQPAGFKAGSDISHPVFSVTKHAGFMPSDQYFKKQVFSRELADYKRVRAGDFAYATIHLDEGSIGIAPTNGLISPMYTVFRSNDDVVHPGYLLRFMKSPAALAQYPRFGRGSVHRRKSISLAALSELCVPLPSLDEQRRIAAVLDHVDTLRNGTAEVSALLGTLTKSTIGEFVQTTVGQSHRLVDIIDSEERLNYGVVQPGADEPGGVPLIRVSDFNRGSIDRSRLRAISPALDRQYARSRLKGTEVLIVCVGMSIGQIAVAGPADIGSNIARAIARIPISDAALRKYVAAYLATEAPQRYFTSELRTVAQPTLNIAQLCETRILIPPRSALVRLSTRLASIEAIQRRCDLGRQQYEALFASLQSRAFQGEL